MNCKHCGEEIEEIYLGNEGKWYHKGTGVRNCNIEAEPEPSAQEPSGVEQSECRLCNKEVCDSSQCDLVRKPTAQEQKQPEQKMDEVERLRHLLIGQEIELERLRESEAHFRVSFERSEAHHEERDAEEDDECDEIDSLRTLVGEAYKAIISVTYENKGDAARMRALADKLLSAISIEPYTITEHTTAQEPTATERLCGGCMHLNRTYSSEVCKECMRTESVDGIPYNYATLNDEPEPVAQEPTGVNVPLPDGAVSEMLGLAHEPESQLSLEACMHCNKEVCDSSQCDLVRKPTAQEPTAVEWVEPMHEASDSIWCDDQSAPCIRQLQQVCTEQAERIAALEQRLAETEEG